MPRTPSLDELLGQERAVESLRGAVASGRVHHAWVFAGPKGVGKRTAAEAFASIILDGSTAPDLAGRFAPDPGSPVQRLIASGAHPDLHIITRELARYSDNSKIRERKLTTIPLEVIESHLLEPIARAPSLHSPGALAGKVFIVDEAELLDQSLTNALVQNSILKTLEEPPPGSVIILVTSREESLLPTIRSRCQRVTFRALDEASMEAWFDRSGIEAAPAERRWLLWYAAGAPGLALEAARTGVHRWMESLEAPLAQAERGRFHPELGVTMAALVEEWSQAWVAGHENASKEAANLTATRHLLTIIAERARSRLREAAGRDKAATRRALRTVDVTLDALRQVAAHVPLAPAMDDLAARLARA